MAVEKVKKHLKIQMIKNGTSIDHIRRGRAIDVLRILDIDGNFPDTVAVGINVPSKVMGKKDIVKVENKFLNGKEVNKIAIISPDATINTIKKYQVVKKYAVSLPPEIIGIIKCPNPGCITNKSMEPVTSKFTVKKRKPLILCCSYCEREIKGEDL